MRRTKDETVGWYRIPEQPRFHRYWDGERWIDQATDDRVTQASGNESQPSS